jgi:hypothetical protein
VIRDYLARLILALAVPRGWWIDLRNLTDDDLEQP